MSGRLANYTQVKDRIAAFWLRHEHGRILTRIITYEDDRAVVCAEVYTDREDARPAATGLAEEIRTSDPKRVNTLSMLENCETSAIGRALANYGMTLSDERPSREEMQKVDRYAQPHRGGSTQEPTAGRPSPAPAVGRPPRAPHTPAPATAPAPAPDAGAPVRGAVCGGDPRQAPLGAEGKREWTVDELLLIAHDAERPPLRRLNAAKMALTKGTTPEHVEAIFRDLERHFPSGSDWEALETIYTREKRNAEEAERSRLAGAAS